MHQKISVCVPCYNPIKFIDETISSLLNQTDTNFQILVCDDCSNDGTWEYLQYRSKDSRIKIYRNQKNIGMHGNHNRCIELASNEYILLLNADDLFCTEDAIKILNDLLNRQNPDLIGIGRSYEKSFRPGGVQYRIYKGDDAVKNILMGKIKFKQVASLMLFRKSKVKYKIDPSDEYWYGKDSEFFYRLFKGSQYMDLKTPLVYYRTHPASATNSISFAKRFRLHNQMLNRWIRNEGVVKLSAFDKAWVMSNDYNRVFCEMPNSQEKEELLREGYTRFEKMLAYVKRTCLEPFYSIKNRLKKVIFHRT